MEPKTATIIFVTVTVYCVALAVLAKLPTTIRSPSSSVFFPVSSSSARRSLQGETEEDSRPVVAKSPDLEKIQTSLLPGELPGYTGWARPVYSLAPTFEIVGASCRDPPNRWIVNLKSNGCNLDQAEHTKFFARAYGPAIIMGRATEYEHCHYDIAFDFFDPGTYWVEIVVTFSHGQIPRHFPLFKTSAESYDDPAYEGYYIPGFPQSLEVEDGNVATQQAEHSKTCTIQDIQVSDPHTEPGRWVMKHRPSYDDVKTTKNMTEISLDGYESGGNAMGAMLTYHLNAGCTIPKHPPNIDQKTVVLFVGDHTFRAQHSYMDKKHSKQENIEMKLVTNSGGMFKMSDEVYNQISKFSEGAERKGASVVILFNTGLHDIFQLCSGEKATARSQHEELSKEEYTCVDHYKSLLMDMASFLVHLPSNPHVFFQTTNAGWPKWGNYGTAWMPDKGQPYPLSPDFVLQFNEIAMNRLQETFGDSITILDGYWTTLARPDNRLVDPHLTNSLEHYLVHPGHQVQKAFLHTWTIVLNDILSQQMTPSTSEGDPPGGSPP